MNPEENEKKIFHDYFLEERRWILGEIKAFLFVVLSYLVNIEDKWEFEQDEIATKISKNFHSLIKSLCQVHGLYGYPALELNSPAEKTVIEVKKDVILVKKDAVRNIFNGLEESDTGRTLAYYCKEAKGNEFWQFIISDIKDLPREPTHIFLEMMRDLYDLYDGTSAVSEMSMFLLEGLPDGNYLKPVVWAEHKSQPECYGVSLGVRSFVRPLYLYKKLSQLRKGEDNGVKLRNVNAYQCVNRELFEKDPSLASKKSKYKVKERKNGKESNRKVKRPCKSCQVFFDGFNRNGEKSFPPFPNCAEHDVIRTSNLDSLLDSIEKTTAHWGEFESACQNHFKAYNELTKKTPENPSTFVEAYYESTRKSKKAKVLKYEWISQNYELIAKDWQPEC